MKILFATDGSKHSQASIEMIAKLNFRADSEITIISIVDLAVPLLFDTYKGLMPSSLEIENLAKENAIKTLENTKAELIKLNPELTISVEVLNGSPESRIVEKAEEINADLIIVGSHGYNRWERLLLGSVSDSVVHHAPCSVLVVRN